MELLRTPHWVVTIDDALHLVRVTRTNVPYVSVQEFEESILGFARIRTLAERKTMKLLLDLREGPMRNDDAFEESMDRVRREVFAGFLAVASLVRTAVGRLQVARMQGDGGATAHRIFNDERAALAFLAQHR
jgi:hypothetical protein